MVFNAGLYASLKLASHLLAQFDKLKLGDASLNSESNKCSSVREGLAVSIVV